MGKTTKGKKPQTQRPKGPGAKAPPRRVSTRVKKPAPTAAELAAPAAQRCGRDDCRVCKPQPCNKCAKCKASPKPTAGRCIEAQKLREYWPLEMAHEKPLHRFSVISCQKKTSKPPWMPSRPLY